MIRLGISGLRPSPEKRQSGGEYSDAVVRLLEAQAAGTAADASSTAAVEAAAGALSRAFAASEVQGPGWVRDAVTPEFLGQVGRDLVRSGDSLHVIQVDRAGTVSLLPCSSWHFEGAAHPDTWRVRATVYGPSTSITRFLPFSGVVFVRWGSAPGQRYVGTGPLSWAHTTAKLQSETERSLAEESSGPVAQLLPIPQDGGDGSKDDPLAELKADIRTARGRALLLETTSGGFGEGMSAAPRKDWISSRLGPHPPSSMPELMGRGFLEVLAACGVPPGLFLDADGTAQRESYRRYFALTVEPLAGLLAAELSAKLEAEIGLSFSGRFAADLSGRARAFQSMVKAGMEPSKAAALAGLMDGGE